MSGRWLTSNQVEIYMRSRKEGKTQRVSAARSGMSERSGRSIEKRIREEPRLKARHWRTRSDPFSDVWSSELLPMLQQSPSLSALTLLEYLQSKSNTDFPDSLLRTLQRRVKQWRHQEGPSCEVMFRQEHIPGHMGLSDFTNLKGIIVTIQGKPFKHLLYHFRLIYSGFSYMKVVLGGESYAALSEGLQQALWSLGGAPWDHRTDSLSAAFKNRLVDDKEDQTKQYEDLCRHYNMTPTRNNRGESHENGGVESPHGHIKRRIKQAFLLRGSYDFDSIESYQSWIEQVVSQHNRRNAKNVDREKMALQPLPTYKTADYTVLPVKVSSSSTIQVRTSLYSVPSRLIGAHLEVHLYHDHLSCYLGGALVATLKRVYGVGKKRRARNIDYHHVIDSLIKKPMAFFKSQLRDALLPNAVYRHIWQDISAQLSAREASRFMVGLLYLAAKADCEKLLGDIVTETLLSGAIPSLKDLQKRFGQVKEPACPVITITQHSLASYNQLIPVTKESFYVLH